MNGYDKIVRYLLSSKYERNRRWKSKMASLTTKNNKQNIKNNKYRYPGPASVYGRAVRFLIFFFFKLFIFILINYNLNDFFFFFQN